MTTHIQYMWKSMVVQQVLGFFFWKVQKECNFSQKAQSGINWHAPAQFSSVQLRFGLLGPGEASGRFGPVTDQFETVYFCCCCCCCLRLSSRIRLCVGSSTPASSRSSSVMSLEKWCERHLTFTPFHYLNSSVIFTCWRMQRSMNGNMSECVGACTWGTPGHPSRCVGDPAHTSPVPVSAATPPLKTPQPTTMSCCCPKVPTQGVSNTGWTKS